MLCWVGEVFRAATAELLQAPVNDPAEIQADKRAGFVMVLAGHNVLMAPLAETIPAKQESRVVTTVTPEAGVVPVMQA